MRLRGLAWSSVGGLVAVLLIGGCTGQSPRANLSTSPTPTSSLGAADTLPAVGATGYPVGTYPRLEPSQDRNLLAACPNPGGVGVATAANAVDAAMAFARQYQTVSLVSDLRGSDRAWWPEVARSWRSGDARASSGHKVPILYSGALSSRWPSDLSAPDPRKWVEKACGARLAQRSWVVVTGPRDSPALQGALVFLVRQDRALLYFTYP